MRVLVTGAAGFIGRNLVRDLQAAGHDVIASDMHTALDPDLRRATWVLGDLRTPALLHDALPGCQRVYHLAAAHLDQSKPSSFYESVNVDAPARLLEAAHEAGVREFLHCSTVGVYGHVAEPPAIESAPKHPGNVYERTKLAGEHELLHRAARLQARLVMVRPAWVYGPDCPRTMRLLHLIRRGRFFYFGSGANLRHPIYIDDLLTGLHLAAEKGRDGAIYNLAGPRAMPLEELIAAAAEAMGVRSPRMHVPMWIGYGASLAAEGLCNLVRRQPPISRRSLVFFRNTNSYSIQAAKHDLQFHPRTDILEGFRRCFEAME